MYQIAPRSPSFVTFEKSELAGSIAARFEKIVALHPDSRAVKTTAAELTYDGLNRAANRIANALLRPGRTADGAVGLILDEESEAIAAILGVLKAGRFYVPLDRTFPRDRIRSIIDDCQLRVLLTARTQVDWAADLLPADCSVIALEDIDEPGLDQNPGLTIQPTATAAIFYTSGTTGRPKGVIQDHQGVMHRAMQGTNALGIGCDDRLTILSAPTYSASLRNLFTALLTGAAAYPFRVREEGVAPLGAWLGRERITVYHSVPSVFRGLTSTLTGQEEFSALRILEIGGEVVTAGDVALFRKWFPSTCIFANVFSSNETGTISRYFVDRTTRIAGSVVPVGYPVDDKEILLVDDDGREVERHQIGEIAVRSRFLSPGYWNRPDLTAVAFQADAATPGERIYRTGDLGCFSADGALLHKGRKDFRAKIRGIRVETEEIEAAIHTHPSVHEAAVVICEGPSGGQTIVAHVAGKKPGPVPGVAALRAFLATSLPDFMLPSAFVFHDALPRLASGKIDRRTLREGDRNRFVRDTAFEPPLDALECDLARMWAGIFGVHPVGVRDNFFELGGDSLKAAEFAARIEKAFNQRLSAAEIVRSPTIEQLAAILRRDRAPEPWSCLVKLQSGDGRRSVFCFVYAGGFRQELFYWAALAPRVRPDYSFYAVIARGSDGLSQPHRSVEEMAAAYIKEIKTVQATGPYFLVGDCFSAPVAYETARQLRASGETIGILWHFDAWGDPWLDRYLGQTMTARVRHHLAPLRKFWRRRKPRIPHHMRALRALGSTARLRYVLGLLWRNGRSTLTELTRNRPGDRRREIVNTRHAAGDARQLQRAFDAYRLAVRQYRHRPYDGTITLIATDEWAEFDPSLGWGADNRVEIHRIPGQHDTAYQREQAHLIADVLRSCLEKAEKQEGEVRAAAETSPTPPMALGTLSDLTT